MFGLVDLDAITLQEDHSFTEFAGRVMFGVYSYITVIVLLNMLIAMMNNSYQIISVRSKGFISHRHNGTIQSHMALVGLLHNIILTDF